MAKPPTSPSDDFFLFNAVPKNSGLKRDEPSLAVRLLCMAIFALAVVDLVVVIFFYRTNARIELIRSDNFTEVVVGSLHDSLQKHENFAEKAKEIIRNKNAYIKEFVDHMEFDSRELEKLDLARIELPALEPLQAALFELERDDAVDVQKLKKATALYNEVEAQLKALNNYLVPVDEFNAYQERIEKNLKTILDEIKGNLDNFLNQLLFLAETQNKNQRALVEEMRETLEKFERVFGFVYANGRYAKLNNYYEVEFIAFDNGYVSFSIEFDERHFGAQLTKQSDFELRMPRVYYCTVQAVLQSENSFSVRMQYVDKAAEEAGREPVVFESEPLSGGYNAPFSYSEVKVFGLESGRHGLYLRVVSEGSVSQLHMYQMKMVCLSYRNFVDSGKQEEEEE